MEKFETPSDTLDSIHPVLGAALRNWCPDRMVMRVPHIL